jgi:WD40 repeat protein
MPTHLPRELATALRAPFFAAATDGGRVHVVGLKTGRVRAAFDTIWSFGGQRLALSPDAKLVAAGAYHVHGAACYDARTGALVWRRADIKKVQALSFSSDGRSLYVGTDDRPLHVLSAADGRTLSTVRDAFECVVSEHGDLRVLCSRRARVEDARGRAIARITLESFGILSASFGPRTLAISEAGGAVRFFDTTSWDEIWRFTPGAGRHALEVAYAAGRRSFVAALWNYNRGGPVDLVDLDPARELVRPVARVRCEGTAGVFASRGRLFLTPTHVVTLSTKARLPYRLPPRPAGPGPGARPPGRGTAVSPPAAK